MNNAINRKTYAYIFIVFLFIHILLSFTVNTPIIYADEAGYISNARIILYDQMDQTFYSAGYSLFLLPAFLISNDIQIAYKLIQIINSLLMSLIPVLTIRLTQYFDNNLKKNSILLISIVASLFPSFILFSNIAMAEALLIPLYLVIVLTFSRLQHSQANNKRIFWAGITLVLSIYLVFVHPRSAVVFLAFFVTALVNVFMWIKNHKSKKVFLSSLFGAALASVLVSFLLLQFGLKGTGYANILLVKLDAFLSADGLKMFFITLNGQVLYLVLATFGLVPLALLTSAIHLFKPSNYKEDPGKYSIVMFVTLSFIFEILLSSWFMIGQTRADHFLYGRYSEGFLLPVLLLGLLAFINIKKDRFLYPLTFISIVVICLSAVYLLADRTENLPVAWLNIFGFYAYNVFFSEFNLAHLSLFFLLLTAIVLSNRHAKKYFAVFLIGILFSASTIYANHDFYRAHSLDKERQISLVKPLNIYREINGDITVNLDRELYDSWHDYNYRVYIPDIAMNVIDLDADNPVGDLILTKRMDVEEIYPGATLVGMENFAEIRMWLLPGENLNHFKKIGFVASDGFPNTLPAEAKYSKISLDKSPSLNLKNEIHIPLQIQHTGSNAFWHNIYSLNGSSPSVRIGAIIYQKDTGEILFETRAELPKVVYPGETVHQDVVIHLNHIQHFLVEGQRSAYIIIIGLVHEHDAWFFSNGDDTLNLELVYDGRRFTLE